MDKSKLLLPISIVVGCIILGGFFYAIQINKQESIERQQKLDLAVEQKQQEAKAEQDKKEYASERRNDCLNIYKTEDSKWSNVRGWRYDAEGDECYIRYKESLPKSHKECDALYPDNIEYFSQTMLCYEGEFEKTF
ncbi:MAG: hypothetical protein NTW66_00480 [Candidatus Magasanikbacteria bacterium]|nr:hypothetical protein [Candidatus Magasanikbacteria bacterium]